MNDARRQTAKYLLDWVVRFLVLLITVLVTVVVVHLQNISATDDALARRIVEAEFRIVAIEASRFTAADGTEVWKAISDRPTRQEIQADLDEIKQMIRELPR
jgi:hypothetical protein